MTAPRPALAAVTAARAISSGQAGPGSAVQAARAGRPAASALEERRPRRVPGPGAGSRARRPGRVRPRRPLGGLRRGRLGGGVALRYREPQHVREGARVAVGDGAGQAGDLPGEHLLGGYHPLQVAEAALVLAVGGPLDEEAVGQLAREPHPDPDARAGPGRRAVPGQGSQTGGRGAPAAVSTAIRATGLSAAGRRVRASFDFLDLPGGLAASSWRASCCRAGASAISGGASDSRSPAVPSCPVSAITPSYQMHRLERGIETRAAGHGEPQLPVPGRSRACLALSVQTCPLRQRSSQCRAEPSAGLAPGQGGN